MAVNVGISANPAGALDAIKSIQSALERAGQAGKQFAAIDLSHNAELSSMSEDIRRLSGRFQDLARVSRGSTAQAFRGVNRAAGGGDPGDFLAWDHALERVFPDPTERARHRANVLGYATQGTRWAPPPPMAPAGEGGGGGGGAGKSAAAAPVAGGGGGMVAPAAALGSMMGGVVGGLAFGGTMMLLQAAKDFAVRSIGLGRDEAVGTEDLYRRTDLSQSFTTLRDSVMAASKGLGVTAQEAAGLATNFAKLTGASDPGEIIANTRMGIGFARAFGMEAGEGVSAMGKATVAGLDPAKFAVLIGEAAAKGGRSADETAPALLRLADAATRSLVTHSNEMQTASMLAGLNAMGLPGLRGQNAEAVMSTLGASISQGGNAGPASAALSYMVGRRQGVTDPYDLQMLQEGGLFASAKSDLGYGSSETNFSARLGELQRLYAGAPQNRLLNAMERDLGVNMRQGRELLRFKPADLSTTFSAMQAAHVDLKDMNPTAIADAVRIANASPESLEDQRQQMLGRHGQGALSDEDKTKLSQTGPKELRDAMLQMASKYGMAETEGSKIRDSEAELSNRLSELGRGLIGPLNDLKDVEGKLIGSVAELTNTISNVYKAARGDPEAEDALIYGKGGVGVGGGERPLANAASRMAESKLMAFFQSQEGGGYTKEQAAGIVAQASAESGYRAHGPAGDGGHARGLMQWHEDRVAAIEAHFGKKLDDMDMLEQAKAHTWELSEGGPEAAAGKALRATTTAYGAGYAETVNDIRPAQKEMRGVARGTLAASIANNPSVSTIAPLQVIHLDQYGNMLGNQELPVTTITPPTPWGPPRAGEASPTPPAPPKARFNTGAQFWGGAP